MQNAKMRAVVTKIAASASALLLAGCDDRDRDRPIDGDAGHRVEGKEALRGLPHDAANAE